MSKNMSMKNVNGKVAKAEGGGTEKEVMLWHYVI